MVRKIYRAIIDRPIGYKENLAIVILSTMVIFRIYLLETAKNKMFISFRKKYENLWNLLKEN